MMHLMAWDCWLYQLDTRCTGHMGGSWFSKQGISNDVSAMATSLLVLSNSIQSYPLLLMCHLMEQEAATQLHTL